MKNDMRRAVFFDRDGVLNEAVIHNGKPFPPANIGELRILSDAPSSLTRLKAAGFLLICVTNQPDVARGKQTREAVVAINAKLQEQLPLDDILVCYHDDVDGCDCRKPAPGLLMQAATRYGIDLSASFMIGDRWRDTEAGHRAGCQTVLIDYGYNERWSGLTPHHITTTLAESVEWILGDIKMKTNNEILTALRVKMFADGADRDGIIEMYRNPWIKGFTTNPTLMRKAGLTDYEGFAKDILTVVQDRPISFEVFSDDFLEMERQAHLIASWGPNVYVKIPITNTKGESCINLLRHLSAEGIRVNVTAMMTETQVKHILPAIKDGPGAFISIFAGRLADAGCDPVPTMKRIVGILEPYKHLELIWASPRELLNLLQADEIGCHIITMTNDLIKKLPLLGKDPMLYSLDTVRMFYDDAVKAGFKL